MINKNKLWFLTITSIIFVLAIYYSITPNDEIKNVFKSTTNEAVIKVEDDVSLTAMKISNDEETEKEIQTLQEVLLSTNKTVDEKNEAYEKIKYINDNKTLSEKLINKIEKELELKVFLKIKENNINVVVAKKEKSSKLANKIITLINDETNNQYYVTVKFE